MASSTMLLHHHHQVIAPHAEEIDRSNSFPNSMDLWAEMGAFGLLGVTAPLEYGGLGLGYAEHCIAMEVSAFWGRAVAVFLFFVYFLLHFYVRGASYIIFRLYHMYGCVKKCTRTCTCCHGHECKGPCLLSTSTGYYDVPG